MKDQKSEKNNEFKLLMEQEGVQPLISKKHFDLDKTPHAQVTPESPQHYSTPSIPKNLQTEQNKLPTQPTVHHRIAREEKFSVSHSDSDRKILKDVTQGKISPFAVLDLHGMTLAEAEIAFSRFLAKARKYDWYLVKVIHGKGGREIEQYPVLKNQMYRWLKAIPEVRAFCSAAEKYGGAGAVYVVLDFGGA